ncbi:preprotein translocase subunit SecE [Coriobacteriaceae bacterium]|nr:MULTISPECIES: preprotein translocase subunit SecE [Atopobiaceae]MBF0599131.1 preprotein translocase subunit SecE [Atopobiaceae bacterium FL090493]TGY58224.1 preprotein translocase subunit SecE [Coriobacteriaceae bacterium]
MAKKDRNKRAARKARQAERQRNEAQAQIMAEKAPEKAPAKSEGSKAPAKAAKSGKPGLIKRATSYFGEVRSEMRRVVWPSREDLKNYTVAVVAILVVFGVAIWLIDSGVVAALIGYSGLRG